MRTLGAALLLTVVALSASARAQDELVCGEPTARTLSSGQVDHYVVHADAGASLFIQSIGRSSSLGPVRMRLSGAGVSQDTCTGIIQFVGTGEDLLLDVSPCTITASGDYTVTLNVASEGAANCGHVLRCGATATGSGFNVAGATDSYQLPLSAGVPAVLKINYLEPVPPHQASAPYVKIFDPSGNEVVPGLCQNTVNVTPLVSGTYTAIVSACGVPQERDYRIELYQESCPEGPTITHFGTTDAMSVPEAPIGFDAAGRPIFNHGTGHDLLLVIEARAGKSGRRPGDWTVPYDDGGGELEDADLQVIVSRPLGNGDPTVCDVSPPNLGGVPATQPLDFNDDDETVRDHIDDMGCRFDDGTREPRGRRDSTEACTFTNQGFGYSFVDRGSAIQYCAQFAPTWQFPDGDTIVAARVKDSDGTFGAVREIVVRIGDPVPATPTATVTPTEPPPPTPTSTPTVERTTPATIVTATVTRTRTPTHTRTPSMTPTGPTPTVTPTGLFACAGDCNGDSTVRVNELVVMVRIAVSEEPLDQCEAGDANHDGTIQIPDLIEAVNHGLNGCG